MRDEGTTPTPDEDDPTPEELAAEAVRHREEAAAPRPADAPALTLDLTTDETWLLSFYRSSELAGALFFGKVASLVRHDDHQVDLTAHFADEAAHAHWWGRTLDELHVRNPPRVRDAYQDGYLEAGGVPANLMEIFALTHVFEKRVIGQYRRHRRATLNTGVIATIDRIMVDEVQHLSWVRRALAQMETRYGPEEVAAVLERYRLADEVVYAAVVEANAEQVRFLGL